MPACTDYCGRHREAPYEAVLGQMVTIREGGTERRVTAAEAFLLQLAKRGVEGDGAAARASLAVLDEASKRPSPSDHHLLGRSCRKRHARAGATANGQEA